jgi:hypothetical protein
MCLEWPIIWPHRIMTFPSWTPLIYVHTTMCKNAVFWLAALCRSCVNRRFEESIAYILRVETFAIEVPTWAGVCCHLLTLDPRWQVFIPWKWRRYLPQKRRFRQDLHGATSQKMAFFKVTSLKTSNIIKYVILLSYIMYSDYQKC